MIGRPEASNMMLRMTTTIASKTLFKFSMVHTCGDKAMELYVVRCTATKVASRTNLVICFV